ncbi:MAG: helix-turn-helix domain-containing protein [Chlorobaculum sp.]|nr:helix-turn-helix domain-containing protein [Chlorobaculum sp.]
MDYPPARTASPDERLMAAIRIIVRQELATVLTSGEPKERLLAVAEAATFLRHAVPTMYGLVQRNQIPYIKKTKRLYFSEGKLNEWLENGENEGPASIEQAVDTWLTRRKSSRKRRQ